MEKFVKGMTMGKNSQMSIPDLYMSFSKSLKNMLIAIQLNGSDGEMCPIIHLEPIYKNEQS